MTDCYTLFRDAYHLAGIEMPDFIVRMTGGVTVRISIWIIWRRRAVSGAVVSGAAGRCAAVLFWFIGAESRRHLLW
ncbi:hypothetical protein ECZU29_62970 [Escherichia coli]|nr:hypothetical protein ECZU29_62970 [Escherichia coli]